MAELHAWKEVQWVSPLITAIIYAIITIVTQMGHPNDRYLKSFNLSMSETTSHAYHEDTVSYPLLCGMSAVVWIVYCVVLEYLLQRDAKKFRIHMATLMLGCLEAVLLTIAVTSAIKTSVGFLRPNFASVCKPILQANGSYVCSVAASEYEKSMISFPSGHASTGTAAGFFTTLYALWTLYFRAPAAADRDLSFVRQVCFLPALAPTLLALTVSVSRVTDFKHHTIDITMGTLLGLLFASVTFVRVLAAVPSTTSGGDHHLVVGETPLDIQS
ncbi:Aste57867_25301 [Aphanomyces stellatus]|uniref:Aste57867_25301 protein n=1 Tax=Aphanomyces stellatus TaxID=120398 RepID=A0A485LV73_9STRA|nr:hypothetical protein As57867_025223 [Aphanomyces stellatus]VFU01926.1 Aste57867_25301 [Aphanomyces stellatus]